jgi:hypothetical protein
MKIAWETLLAGLLVAASILFIGRYEISAMGYGWHNEDAADNTTEKVYRLDRWTGKIQECSLDQNQMPFDDLMKKFREEGAMTLSCAPPAEQQKSN